jgi:hypothetical protein
MKELLCFNNNSIFLFTLSKGLEDICLKNTLYF